MTTNDIVFMDTETLGLHPDAPIWEFAAIRRFIAPNGASFSEVRYHCFIDHYPLPWIDDMDPPFVQDYRARYQPDKAVTQFRACQIVREATGGGAHVVGAVPNFDTERIQKMLDRNSPDSVSLGMPWHYHLIDVENLAVGYLAAKGLLMVPPWKSDELSAAIGVDPKQFNRHTAMGDVEWVKAQYDSIMDNQKGSNA